MPKSFFLVRAVVAEPLRDKFDHWYSTDHLPRALADFKAEKCWRFWSHAEAGVRPRIYRFADKAKLDAALASRPSRRWSPTSIAPGRKASRARAIS